MKISLTSVPVDNQAKALEFYTQKLGFRKKEDSPMGEHRWLTVISPEGVEGVELLLEPTSFPPAAEYQKALYEAGIPATAFQTHDLDTEVGKLRELGVVFRGETQQMDDVAIAIFEDTCGNLICLAQPNK